MSVTYPVTTLILMAGVALILAFGVPAMMWLLQRIRPQTPEQAIKDKMIDEAKREARRRIGKLPF